MEWRNCLLVGFVALGLAAGGTVAGQPADAPAQPSSPPASDAGNATKESQAESGAEPEAMPEEPHEQEPEKESKADEEKQKSDTKKSVEESPKDKGTEKEDAEKDSTEKEKPKTETEKSKEQSDSNQEADKKHENNSADENNAEVDKAKDDKSKSKQVEDKQEKPKRKLVELGDKTAAVLKKRYPQNLADLKLIQKQTHRVIDHTMPAVVSVQVGGAFGSAVIVNPEGLVLTAGHVVGKPGQPVRFIFADGKTARGKTLGMYREIDSGMMQITDPGPWPYADIAKSGDIKVGQWVVAIGQPGGFDPERSPPVRLGRVLFSNKDVISTDCTLVGGDSGGPLFNMRGEVVAIHSRIGRRITDNFHVPISTYHDTWSRLAAGESWGAPLGSGQAAEARPLLGIAANPDAPGCRLTEVHPPYPAYKAGLRVGDVVTTFNGKKVDSFESLRKFIYGKKPGDSVKLAVQRGEKTLEMDIRLGVIRKPMPGSAELPKKASSKQKKDK